MHHGKGVPGANGQKNTKRANYSQSAAAAGLVTPVFYQKRHKTESTFAGAAAL